MTEAVAAVDEVADVVVVPPEEVDPEPAESSRVPGRRSPSTKPPLLNYITYTPLLSFPQPRLSLLHYELYTSCIQKTRSRFEVGAATGHFPVLLLAMLFSWAYQYLICNDGIRVGNKYGVRDYTTLRAQSSNEECVEGSYATCSILELVEGLPCESSSPSVRRMRARALERDGRASILIWL